MDAPCKIQGSIHVFRLVNNMCPGKWVHIKGIGAFSVHFRYERMLEICHKDERVYFMRTASANSSSVISFSSKMISLIEQPRLYASFTTLALLS